MLGIIAIGLVLFFWPAVNDGFITIIDLLVILLTLYLLFNRAWLPLLISLVAVWQGLAMMGGAKFFNLMWPILFFVPMGLFVWLLVRKAWLLSAISFIVILTGLVFIG
jgi:hypothetical protein